MTNIYDKHQAAFKHVEAYVITDKSGNRLATVAFKRSASNLRLTCFLHIIGLPMVSRAATGYGYDKASAAFDAACDKLHVPDDTAAIDAKDYTEQVIAFRKAATTIGNDGSHWDRALRDSGFNVLQAV